eukprot:5639092-Pleurochrysis_carterae.AAC.2
MNNRYSPSLYSLAGRCKMPLDGVAVLRRAHSGIRWAKLPPRRRLLGCVLVYCSSCVPYHACIMLARAAPSRQ